MHIFDIPRDLIELSDMYRRGVRFKDQDAAKEMALQTRALVNLCSYFYPEHTDQHPVNRGAANEIENVLQKLTALAAENGLHKITLPCDPDSPITKLLVETVLETRDFPISCDLRDKPYNLDKSSVGTIKAALEKETCLSRQDGMGLIFATDTVKDQWRCEERLADPNVLMEQQSHLRKKFNILSALIPQSIERQRGRPNVTFNQTGDITTIKVTYGPIQGSWHDAAKLCETLSEVRVDNENPLITGDPDDISDLPDKAYAGLSVETPVKIGDNAEYGVDDNGDCYLQIVSEQSYLGIMAAVEDAIDAIADPEPRKKLPFREGSNWYYHYTR